MKPDRNTSSFGRSFTGIVTAALVASFAFGAELERDRTNTWGTVYYGREMNPYGGQRTSTLPAGTRRRIGALGGELEDDPCEKTGWVRFGRALFPGHRHVHPFFYGMFLSMMVARTDFGLIKATGVQKAKMSVSDRNWTNVTLTSFYTAPDRSRRHVSVTASRLTPAILVESDSQGLTLFGGKKYNWLRSVPPKGHKGYWGGQYYHMDFLGRPQPVSFLAVGTENDVTVRPAGRAEELPTAALKDGWLLVWFGPKGIGSSPKLTEHATPYWVPHNHAAELDSPFLLVFEKPPDEIFVDDLGGVMLSFDGEAGRLVFTPLLGDRWPPASETAKWADGLPKDIIGLCRSWAPHLRHYPVEVAEEYLYDRAADEIVIRDEFEFTKVGRGGSPLAPLPPMLSLACDHGFPAAVEPAPGGPEMLTGIGPYRGVPGRTGYAVRIRGLGKYWKEIRVPKAPVAGEGAVLERLRSQVGLVLKSGEIFSSEAPFRARAPLWNSAGDYMYSLLEAHPFLSRAEQRQVVEYLNAVMERYPPDTPAFILPWEGMPRTYEGRPRTEAEIAALKKKVRNWARSFPSVYKMVPWRNLYAVSRYLAVGGPYEFEEVAGRGVIRLLMQSVLHQDWANLGWFQWSRCMTFNPYMGMRYHFRWYGTGGAADANNWFAATLGAARLARHYGRKEEAEIALGLFAKAAALRLAQGKLKSYLYDKGFWTRKPASPLTAPGNREPSAGYIHRSEWKDARDVLCLDEFGASLWDIDPAAGGKAPCAIFPLRDVVPELARFLGDYLKPETKEFVEHYSAFDPAWYLVKKDPMLGSEATVEQPETGHQVFLGHAIAGADGAFLKKHLDQPWYPVGDFYFLNRLTETLTAYRGCTWKAWSGRSGSRR